MAPAEARPPLPENPDTMLQQSNMEESLIDAEGISAIALIAVNATAKKAISAVAKKAIRAVANEAISAPCAED